MLLHQFPDIEWLKKQIHTGFENSEDRKWPNVILNAKGQQIERKDIKGPFSIFMTDTGTQHIKLDNAHLKITPNQLGISNFGQHYDLRIHDKNVDTFNIHFGEALFKETVNSVGFTHEQSLDNPFEKNKDYNILHQQISIDHRVEKLKRALAQNLELAHEETLLSELLTHILGQISKNLMGLESIDAQKKSTRVELYNSVSQAIHQMQDSYSEVIDIDMIASSCAMSKFHFIRVFKEIMGISPNQYLKKIRLERSLDLLQSTDLPIHRIGYQIGYQEPNSFIRSFKQAYGISPNQHRQISNFG
jgi:AraC family transcriptional regulator